MQFSIGDRLAHPMHGAGVVEDIVEREIDGIIRKYYVVHMTSGDMTLMVPCELCAQIGVRAIVCEKEADQIINALDEVVADDNQNWSKRYQENIVKIKSGDLLQVAAVIKGLLSREGDKGLSTGERKLLSSAKQILVSELMLAKETTYEETDRLISTRLIG